MNIQLVKVEDTKMENYYMKNNPSLPVEYIYGICIFIDTHECMPHKYASLSDLWKQNFLDAECVPVPVRSLPNLSYSFHLFRLYCLYF